MVIKLNEITHMQKMAELEAIKPLPIIKKARKIEQEHIKPSLSLNILKLCNKLRGEGFNKHAEDLEEKFLSFKHAGAEQSKYNLAKEKGEDLVEEAHKDGDAHVSDAKDENGDVETIISRHNKIVDVVNKMPTGKLASKEIILKMVKTVLAQSDPEQKYQSQIEQHMKNIQNTWERMKKFYDNFSFISEWIPVYGQKTKMAGVLVNSLNDLIAKYDITIDDIETIKNDLKQLKFISKPGITGILTEDQWNQLTSPRDTFATIENSLDAIIHIREQVNSSFNEMYNSDLIDKQTETNSTQNQKVSELNKKIDDLKNKINSATHLTPQAKEHGIQFLSAQSEAIKNPANQTPEKLETLEKALTDLATQWKL